MDFPTQPRHKPVISSVSPEAVGLMVLNENAAAVGSSGWPAVNRAIFVPFTILSPYPVRTLWWLNGTAVAGNVDVGVLSIGGALLLNAGSTAQAGTSTVQQVSLGTPVLLTPGSYYMAMECSSTSATVMRNGFAGTLALLSFVGVAQQDVGSMPLPAAATPSSISNSLFPHFGIASAGVV